MANATDVDYLQRASQWPWFKPFYNWKPFTLDALGLVTLLGHEEVNEGLGRLVPSRYVEYFPMLGAFVVAGDRFKEKPSFNLYNITDGIHTTDLSCWLTRWLMAQDFEKTCSMVQFEVADEPRSFWKWKVVAFSLSFIFTGLLLAMTILSDDKYGKVNVVAMIISVIVRTYVLEANRSAIDEIVQKAELKRKGGVQYKKCVVILSDSKAVTMFIPSHIIPVLIFNPEPKHGTFYHGVRWLGWAAFAVHVLTVGNATLIVQEYVVALIVIPTILMHWKFGCDDSKWVKKWQKFWGPEVVAPYECWIGSRLRATCFEWPLNVEFIESQEEAVRNSGGSEDSGRGSSTLNRDITTYSEKFHDKDDRMDDERPKRIGKWSRLPSDTPLTTEHPSTTGSRSNRRQDLYAWLNLTADEESSMGKWDLFPHERQGNKTWWTDYNAKKALIAADPPRIEDMKRYKHITKMHKKKRTTTQDEIATVTTQRVDSEKITVLSYDEPKLGLPRVARYSVSGPDGLVRAQTANVH